MMATESAKPNGKTGGKANGNANLYAALRANFSVDLDAVAVETDDGLFYSWRDLERASAMIANLLGALDLEPGAR
ncbi:MAG: malonyl-CoA synthase, partial [Variovorax sp.]|nr:malonyl-CoA synthase [Variovorax sp.]